MRISSRFRRRPVRLLVTAALAIGSLTLAAVGASPASATTTHQATVSPSGSRLHGQTPVVGFFRGEQIRYLDEGPVQLAKDAAGHYLSDVDPIWVVTNGARGQHNIIDNVPGLNRPDDYTPLWQVVTVTWTNGHPRLLDSARDVQRAQARHEVVLTTTDTIVNCPVLGFDQKPAKGFFRGGGVRYLDEGPIQLAKDAAGHYLSDVDPIWAVTNGVTGQRNIIDNVPNLNNPDDYTPLWQVITVTWRPGATPRLLTSAVAVSAAAGAGLVDLVATDTVVNCPVL
jgi:hypothetical protein